MAVVELADFAAFAEANDRPGWVSADGCRLSFDSDRTGTWDLFVARRSP